MNTPTPFRSAVFENQFIRFNYAVSENGLKPFLFFTGFGENPIHYKRFLKHLPPDFFLLVVKSPIQFKQNSNQLEMAIIELLIRHKLPLNISIGGFSFGNWVVGSLLFSKKITINACIFISVPSTLNYRLYQAFNQNKVLNFITKKIVKSTIIFKTLTRFRNLILTIKTKNTLPFSVIKKLDFKAEINYYLGTPIANNSIHAILTQANNLAIPCLLLKSNQDPVTPSDSFYLQAQKHIQKLVIIRVDSIQHSAFIEEFIKKLGSFLSTL